LCRSKKNVHLRERERRQNHLLCVRARTALDSFLFPAPSSSSPSSVTPSSYRLSIYRRFVLSRKFLYSLLSLPINTGLMVPCQRLFLSALQTQDGDGRYFCNLHKQFICLFRLVFTLCCANHKK
jgi:hypothetical protein